MTLPKLGFILLLIAAFFALFIFGPYYDNLEMQLALLALIIFWNSWRTSVKRTLDVLESTLPFLASLLAFGVLFQLFQLQGRTDWLYDTLIKGVIFPSSLLFLRVTLDYITYLDLLSLPIPMRRRFDLIAYKAAFQKGSHSLSRFNRYLDSYPYLQEKNRLRRWFLKYASLIVALYLYLYEETVNANLLLQNRYKHLGDQTIHTEE
jgi:hypothetical protein